MHTAVATPRFNAMIKLRVPAGMPAAVAQVARRRHQSASEWLRQVVLDRLSQEGVEVGGDASPDREAA